MSLDSFVKITAIPELFERLQADAEQFRGDLERLQRFVELTTVVVAGNYGARAERGVVPAPPPAPEPSARAPVEMEAGARQRLEDDADAAAKGMVLGIDLMTRQGQTTATSLAYALRIAREASAGFECPQTMGAILRVLDGMDAAAREEQSNG